MKTPARPRRSLLAFLAVAVLAHAAQADGLRVATWNITYYGGDRAAEIGTAVYGQWQGKSFSPDVICLQEMTSVSAVNALVSALNAAPGSPGDWVRAPFYSSGTLSTALVYRTGKVTPVAHTLVAPGGAFPNHPRNIVRYDIAPVGYSESASVVSVYPIHFKAFHDDPNNDIRRFNEAVNLTNDIAALPAGRHVVVGADFNIRRSTDPAFALMVGDPFNTGLLRDPINRGGEWFNNIAFRNIHTQDPNNASGMDDRLDQVLLSPSLVDGQGMDYIGDYPRPWDLRVFEDPNHSYRAWGNDGSSFNTFLRIQGNAMVGPVIAQALVDMAAGGGHLPVFLDLAMPGRLGIDQPVIELGPVPFSAAHPFEIAVRNAGDTALWGVGGISPLSYNFSSGGAVSAPAGPFAAEAGADPVAHAFTLDTTAWPNGGPQSAPLVVTSNDPARPNAPLQVRFEVVGCNASDLATPFGQHTFVDLSVYLNLFNAGDARADLAEPVGVFNAFDLFAFLNSFTAGCP